MKIYLSFLSIIFSFCACSSKQKVDKIVHHAKIYTVNTHFDTATTMVIHQGKILAIGDESILTKYESDTMIDATGKFVYPGFIDAHCHFTGEALDAYKLKLFGCKSFNEVIQQCVNYSTNDQHQWLEGTGWDQNIWDGKQFPTKDTLDVLFPDRPVFLLRIDGHAALVNQKALDLANIHEGVVNGENYVKKSGKLTGVLIDHAMDQVRSKLPHANEKEAMEDIQSAQNKYFQVGLTGIVECGVKDEVITWLQKAYASHHLKLRTTMMLNADSLNLVKHLSSLPLMNDWLHVAGFKVYTDGSLGSRGAFLKQDYCDKIGHRGSLLLSADSLDRIAHQLINSKYQLCAHAIGDGANSEVLSIYAGVLKSKNDRRWRIEHAQVVPHNEMHLFADYAIIPSVQPTHATSDMYWANERLGASRMKDAYAYKQLLKQNNWLPLGTDFPVENLNPILTFFAAVFRMDKELQPQNGFQMENALSREEALRGITIWAAKSVFEEDKKGSLEAGKFADFVIVDTDLMHADATAVYRANVIATYVNGELVYHSK